MAEICIIGAGLAGCEAAYQAAKRGHDVTLIDCKPQAMSAAHKSENFAELVCSNSLKSKDSATAGGVLKSELKAMDCLLLKIAESVSVPAGNALAVNRDLFSSEVTKAVKSLHNIKIVGDLAEDFDDTKYTVIATGPLTLGGMENAIINRLGDNLHFYDAAAPIISTESLDREKLFCASRYDKGDSDYLNCPMTKDEYEQFWCALVNAECVTLRDFERSEIFEGCMPIEIMAKRGKDTLRFGPLKPVGFIDPISGKRPYAVVQLRAENNRQTMYNLVGFQTNLKFDEQKRVFSMIPALKNAEFLRLGVMHRNSYVNAPRVLNAYFQTLKFPKVFIAGQLSGVEGYVESIGSGLLAGVNAARLAEGKGLLSLPETTVLGALTAYLSAPNANFQPMNSNFGILPPLDEIVKDKNARKMKYYERSVKDLNEFKIANNLI